MKSVLVTHQIFAWWQLYHLTYHRKQWANEQDKSGYPGCEECNAIWWSFGWIYSKIESSYFTAEAAMPKF